MADNRIVRFFTSGPTPAERSEWRTGGASEALQRQYQIADHLQIEVARRIRASVAEGRWAADSTGRLERVTVDGANRRADFYSITVGIPSFLNRSMVAKYWRTQELGSVGAGWRFTGRIVVPRDLGKKAGGTGTRAAGMLDRFDSPAWRDTRMRTISDPGAFRFGPDKFRVKKEIDAQDAYGSVLRDFARGRISGETATMKGSAVKAFASNAAQTQLRQILRQVFVNGYGDVWSR